MLSSTLTELSKNPWKLDIGVDKLKVIKEQGFQGSPLHFFLNVRKRGVSKKLVSTNKLNCETWKGFLSSTRTELSNKKALRFFIVINWQSKTKVHQLTWSSAASLEFLRV